MRVKEDLEEASFSTLSSREPPRNQQNIASGAGTGSVPITSNNNTAALCREIRIVQDLIERCLQLFLDKDEVVKTLFEQARIQPDFTRIVDNLHNGYTLLQQHPIPSTVHPQNDSMGTFSNYDLVYENPESGNFHSTHMNYGGWMPMDNNTADIAPTQPFTKSEIPSPVSVAPFDQYPFVPREMPKSVDPSSFDLAELSHVRSPGQVLLQTANAGFNNLSDIGEYLVSTGLRDPSEQNDNVDKFFADTIPATHSQS
ncbi:uncharacterized protein LOC133678241 isoform X3 [Populus nigra]|uniref:uncharacterized protein LOC133678241 isoform X3 n=1 Tax=Populus nigra TaxID=3691 RepID=UPI002B275D39|nr:uncharacterized protein LOC133678241 isoform X3 [Populus nigra]